MKTLKRKSEICKCILKTKMARIVFNYSDIETLPLFCILKAIGKFYVLFIFLAKIICNRKLQKLKTQVQ